MRPHEHMAIMGRNLGNGCGEAAVTAVQSLWLMIAAQAMIFGLMWWVAARAREELRRSLGCLALFNMLQGLGVLMVALRNDTAGYYLLTHGAADALILWSLVFMWEGARLLLQNAERSQEPWIVAGLLTVPILALGAYPERTQERVAVLLCGLSYLILRACHAGTERVAQRFGHRLARLEWGMAVAISVFLLVRAMGGLGGLWSLDAGHDGAMSSISVYITFVALTLVNSVLAFSVLRVLMGELEHLTNHDALTSLLNRRGLAERLEASWARWVRHRRAFGLLCVDVDYFKRVNDRYGHAAGDEVLCAVARTLAGEVRAVDMLARTGGEEFVVLLEDDDSGGELAQVAERLRWAVAQIEAPEGSIWQGLQVRVSVGASLVHTRDIGWKDTIHRADTALYDAKRAGRDCVRVAIGGGGAESVAAARVHADRQDGPELRS